MINVCIKRAEPVDAAAVYGIESKYIDCPWSFDQIENEIAENDMFFVAFSAGVGTVGYLSGNIAADECEIANIAVETAYRRNGVATALFERLFEECKLKSAKSVFLLVRVDNTPAIRLYEKIGFIAVGKRRGYYGGGDAVIMRRDL